MSEGTFESSVLQKLVPDLKADGYDVIVEPSGRILPEFLKSYQPDLIAYRGNEKLAIEIKRGSKENQKEQLKDISKLFEGQDEWKFQVFWLPETSSISKFKRQSKNKIIEYYQKSKSLAENGDIVAAFLVAWLTLEAVARRAIGSNLEKPQTPARIIEQLAKYGYLTPNEADKMRLFAQLRNRLVHGDLELEPSKQQLEEMLNYLGTIVSLVAKSSNKVA